MTADLADLRCFNAFPCIFSVKRIYFTFMKKLPCKLPPRVAKTTFRARVRAGGKTEPELGVRDLRAHDGFLCLDPGGKSEGGASRLDAAALHAALAGRSAPIKTLLLDQRLAAGLGNIYVCEALHRAKIHPRRAAGRISKTVLNRLVPAIREVIEEAIAAGGSTLRDYARPDGELGYFSKRFAVYDREGQSCACGTPVRRIVQGGRSTFYCPKCQH
jgi:hypothetical protein